MVRFGIPSLASACRWRSALARIVKGASSLGARLLLVLVSMKKG